MGFIFFLYESYSYPINTHITNVIVIFLGGNKRLEKGTTLWKAGYAPLLFITGVQSGKQLNNFFIEHQVPTEHIIFSTAEYNNIVQYADQTSNFILTNNIHSVRLITSRYNMPVSLLQLRTKLPHQIKVIPHPTLERENFLTPFKEYFYYIYRLILNFF